MDRFVDLRFAHPGEGYELCILGKPRMSYDFHFSDGTCRSIHDGAAAAGLMHESKMIAATSFYFCAVDCYDDETRLFRADADLLAVLRNLQKAGASFGGLEGDKVEIRIGPGSVRHLVKVVGKYVLPESSAGIRDGLMAAVPPPSSVTEITSMISSNVMPPVNSVRWPSRSVEGKEYVAATLDGDDLADFLCIFVKEVALSDHPLADAAARIMVEINNQKVFKSFNERMSKL